MEKSSMYTVMSPPPLGEPRRPWVSWLAAVVSLVALVVAVVTACVVVSQAERIGELEEKVLEMRLHFEHVLDEFDYADGYDYADAKLADFEGLTIQQVVRKKREAGPAVPIYDQAYGVNLGGPRQDKGLSLYSSLLANEGSIPRSPEVSWEVTDSPIKPHHRISPLWVSKPERRQRHNQHLSSRPVETTVNAIPEALRRRAGPEQSDETAFEIDAEVTRSSPRRRAPVMQRSSRVKATERLDTQANGNSVVPPPQPSPIRQAPLPPQPVFQTPSLVEQTRTEEVRGKPLSSLRTLRDGSKKKRPRKKHSRRRFRSQPAVTVAHFVAAPNTTLHHGSGRGIHQWVPAAWMDKLGLNRKYTLRQGSVTVKEAGLYYVYAQVLYEPGRFGSGYQVVVDSIPIMECSLAPAQPSHSCHTGGATYLPRNAAVYIRDMESRVTPTSLKENTFFGLVKLMDAPDTAEELILG